ncbi:cadherin-like domain-containing protein, partial [Tropicibacter naphthalenivorans]
APALSVTQDVTITITGTNDAPVVSAIDAGSVSEDDPLQTIDLLAGQTDVDNGAVLTAINITATDDFGASVQFIDNGDGTISINPIQYDALDDGEARTVTVSYEVSDGQTSTANTATLVVNGASDGSPPVANDDVLGVPLGNNRIIEIEPNNSIAQAQNLDGLFTLNPNPNILNSDTLPSVNIVGTGNNTADYYAFTVTEAGTSMHFDIDFGSSSGGSFDAYIHLWNSAGARISRSDDSPRDPGSVSSLDSELSYTFSTPGTYYISVGRFPGYSNPDNPVPSGGTYELQITTTAQIGGVGTDEDTALTIPAAQLLANDTDPDGDALSISAVSASSALGAAVTLNGDGSVSYDPTGAAALAALADGQELTDSFTYTITDGNGGFDTATVSLTVVGTNDAPVVSVIDAGTVTEDDAIQTIDLLAGQTDPDSGAVLTAINITATDDQGNAVSFTDNGDGTISIDPFQYDALDDGQARAVTISYEISDGQAATANTATLVVNGVTDNLAPVANDDALAAQADENTAFIISAADLLTNDSDPDGDAIGISAVSATSALGATVTLNGDGSVSYDPTASATLDAMAGGESLTDSFTYTISDGNGAFDTATVTLTVTGVNDPPVLTGTTAPQTGFADEAFSYQLPADLFADHDQGLAVTYDVTLADGSPLPSFMSFDAATGTLSYAAGAPQVGDIGLYTLMVTATEPDGQSSSTSFTLSILDGELIQGTEGNDSLTGTIQGDLIQGLGGNDTIVGIPGADFLDGGDGNDTLYGEAGDDVLLGGLGNDRLDGGSGSNVLRGGDGHDYMSASGSTGNLFDGGSGNDTVYAYDSGSNNVVVAGDGDDRVSLYGYGSNSGSNQLDGGLGNDQLYAGGENNTITGGEGNDTLSGSGVQDGGAGDDYLNGYWQTDDTLLGGDGADFLRNVGGRSADSVDAGAGDDIVQLGLDRYTNDVSTITLGAGSDTVRLGNAEFNGTGHVVVTDFDVAQDLVDIDQFLTQRLSGWDGASNPFGAGFLRLVADGADTVLEIDADGGGDTYVAAIRFQGTAPGDFTDANFLVDVATAQGYAPDGSGVFGTALGGTLGDDALAGSIGDDTMTGLDGNDSLSGENGADLLDGNAGADTLIGGFGDDTLTGGADADVFVFSPGGGDDVVTDFDLAADIVQLDAALAIGSLSEVDTDGVGGVDSTLVTFDDQSSALLLQILGVTDPNDLLT